MITPKELQLSKERQRQRLLERAKPQDRKYGTKGSDYRAGRPAAKGPKLPAQRGMKKQRGEEVPAFEESLYNTDDLG